MSKSKKYFNCEYVDCKASFSRRWKLENHIKLHENLRLYVCSYDGCDKSYTWLQHLKRHEETHENKDIFSCTETNCDQTFTSKNNLKRHVENVHLKKKSKMYKCSHCDKQFNKHSWLKHHESEQHMGLKPYVCTHGDCGQRFIFPNKLRKHMKIHEGYTCTKPDCNEVFSKWTLYRKHLQVAHPRIYKCDFCEKQFSKLYNYRSHLSIHELDRKVYECPEPNCSRFYLAAKNLTHHIKSYHENRPFSCSDINCDKNFKTEAEMMRHFLYQHDLNKPLKKKKKRQSFAAKLSGCAPKTKKSVKSQTENKAVQETESIGQMSDVAKNNQVEVITITDESMSNECHIDNDVQNLLNMIDENALKATKLEKTKYVSFQEFVKL